MPERVVLLVTLAAVIAVAIMLARHYAARRLRAVVAGPAEGLWATLGTQPDGRSTVVAFSTPSCAACHNAQAPAVKKVAQTLGADRVRVIGVDAAEQPEVASAFGVMTVPATAVLAPTGHVVAINQGFAPSVKLLAQLSDARG